MERRACSRRRREPEEKLLIDACQPNKKKKSADGTVQGARSRTGPGEIFACYLPFTLLWVLSESEK